VPEVATAGSSAFIAGEWADVTGDEFVVSNPANDEPLARLADAGEAAVDAAVKAATAALDDWRDRTPGERANALFELAEAVEGEAESLGKLESLNAGKPVDAAVGEIEHSADVLRFFAGAGRVLEGLAAGEFARGRTSFVRRDPVGVVGQITPWNYPLNMASWKIGPALAAGNTVVLKPSELTPLTTLRLAELSAEILPPGVLNVVAGLGETTGDAIVRHPDVAMVSLTGDVSTGIVVAERAAQAVKRVHLELGGKAPVLVFDDAPLDKLARKLRGASYWNAGQDCTAACRLLVADSVYDEVLDGLVFAAGDLRVGDPAGDGIDMGPVISPDQKRRVLGFVERAVDAGAEVRVGGDRAGAGAFIEPMVITGVDQSSEIVQREVFGPVVTVQRFSDEDAAVRWARDVEYGLAASVWSRDVARCFRVVRQLDFGAVWVNDHITGVHEMPHGGFKRSGYGKDLSKYALEDYTVVKHVMVDFRP
jgi:1-pyrroline dehydrogenase